MQIMNTTTYNTKTQRLIAALGGSNSRVQVVRYS